MVYWTKELVVDPTDKSGSTWFACVFADWGLTRKPGAPTRGGLYRTTNRGKSWSGRLDGVTHSGDALGEARIESVHVHVQHLQDERNAHSTASSAAAAIYMTTEGAGLWHSVYDPTRPDGALHFSTVPSFPFSHPTRVLSNPYNRTELWVTSFGNGLYSGVVAAAVDNDDTGDNDDDGRRSNTRQQIMQALAKTDDGEVLVAAVALPARVTVAANGSPTELWAADRLAEVLGKTLVKLPPPPAGDAQTMPGIDAGMSAAGAVAASQIAVGFGAATALGISPSTLSVFGDDAFFIGTARGGSIENGDTTKRGESGGGSSLVVASSVDSARGTMNGAFELMRMLDFSFLTENVTIAPKLPVSLPPDFPRGKVFSPPLVLRDMMTSPVTDHSSINRALRSNFSASLGLNGNYDQAPVGGTPYWPYWGYDGSSTSWPRAGFVGTAFALLSPHLLAPRGVPDLSVWQEHPEWFVCKSIHCKLKSGCPPEYPCSLESVNVTYHAQPCWSNTSLQKYMVGSIRRILHRNPNATSISVSNMDGNSMVCPADDAINAAENTTGGANFRAVQAIADTVNKEFPHIRISTLAYNGALQPPAQLKFRPNVIVQLCTQPMNEFLPLSHPRNKPSLELIRAWAKAVPTLYIWDYTNNYHDILLPFPNYFTQATHIREMQSLGVDGYLGQGITNAGVEMIDLKTYVAGRTAFDPSLPTDSLVVEFTDGFYSSTAAPHVRAYMGIIAAAFNSSSQIMGDGFNLNVDSVASLNHSLLAAASALVTAKQAAEPGESYQLRLSEALLNVQWVVLQRWDRLRAVAVADQLPWPFATTLAEEFGRFAAALTYAFRRSNQAPHFLEQVSQGARRTKKDCDLRCFAQQLGLNASSLSAHSPVPLKSDEQQQSSPPPQRTVMAWVSTDVANWPQCAEFLTTGPAKGTVNAVSIDNLYTLHPSNGTLIRRLPEIAAHTKVWQSSGSFRTYPMIGFGDNVTLLRQLWSNPTDFIMLLRDDAVRYNYTGINIDFEPKTMMDDSDPRSNPSIRDAIAFGATS